MSNIGYKPKASTFKRGLQADATECYSKAKDDKNPIRAWWNLQLALVAALIEISESLRTIKEASAESTNQLQHIEIELHRARRQMRNGSYEVPEPATNGDSH